MKQVKGFIIVLAGLFIMVTLVSLLIPSRVMTARSVVIHAAKNLVFSEIKDLDRWKGWHPVFMNNSNSIIITNSSTGKNAAATWTSNGRQNKFLITAVTANQIEALLLRKGENEITNIISLDHVNDSTAIQVQWRVITKLKWYPWEKFYGIFLDKITGPGYEAALNNLKNLLENKN